MLRKIRSLFDVRVQLDGSTASRSPATELLTACDRAAVTVNVTVTSHLSRGADPATGGYPPPGAITGTPRPLRAHTAHRVTVSRSRNHESRVTGKSRVTEPVREELVERFRVTELFPTSHETSPRLTENAGSRCHMSGHWDDELGFREISSGSRQSLLWMSSGPGLVVRLCRRALLSVILMLRGIYRHHSLFNYSEQVYLK